MKTEMETDLEITTPLSLCVQWKMDLSLTIQTVMTITTQYIQLPEVCNDKSDDCDGDIDENIGLTQYLDQMMMDSAM